MALWTDDEMEWHACPRCGTTCPPRLPEHGPTIRHAVESLTLQLLEPHEPDCEMAGSRGNHQGFIYRDTRASCGCSMRDLYRLRLKLQRIYDHDEDDD